MTWIDIQNELIQDFMKLTQTLKDLAPKNSTYQSRDNGKLVDYIYVDGKRTRSNTNNLYNSIGFDIEFVGNDIVSRTVVSGSVPYYDKAVLKPTLTVATHHGRVEYGNDRYPTSIVGEVINRNYLYYMFQGEIEMLGLKSKWDGKTFKVESSIGDFK